MNYFKSLLKIYELDSNSFLVLVGAVVVVYSEAIEYGGFFIAFVGIHYLYSKFTLDSRESQYIRGFAISLPLEIYIFHIAFGNVSEPVDISELCASFFFLFLEFYYLDKSGRISFIVLAFDNERNGVFRVYLRS